MEAQTSGTCDDPMQTVCHEVCDSNGKATNCTVREELDRPDVVGCLTGVSSITKTEPSDELKVINTEEPPNVSLITTLNTSENSESCNESLGMKIASPFSVEGLSSNESSCLNSPLCTNINGIDIDFMSQFNVEMVIKEYEKLKKSYCSLQSEYQASLEKEKELCEKLKEYGGQDDESCNTLASVNSELRKELDFVLAEQQRLKNENKSLQDKISSKGTDGGKVMQYQLGDIESTVKLEKAVSELQTQVEELKEERDNAKEKLAAHDAAAKRAITALQKEMSAREEQITKVREDEAKERDTLVLKIAKQEKKLSQNDKAVDGLEKKLTESKKEIERLKVVLKQKDFDQMKMQGAIQEKDDEIGKLKAEVEKNKEEDASQNVKVKWAQNKLKQELEAHKDTKAKLAQVTSKVEEMREEGEQIRLACQEMIKKYQSSEEMRSVQLDKALQEKDSTIKVHEHEIAVQNEIGRKKSQELEALKMEHRKALGEISQLKTTVSMLEGKLSNYSIKSTEMEKRIAALSKKEEELVLVDKRLNDTSQDLKGYKEQVSYYVQLEEKLRRQLLDSETEAFECKKKEAELLTYTKKITEDNAHWKSQASDLQYNLENSEAEIERLRQTIEKLNSMINNQDANSTQQKEVFQVELDELTHQVEQKRKLIEELALNLEEAQDEIKVQKRKSTSTIKDLQRQLHHSKKRIDQLEEFLSTSQDGATLKSRASSSGSLDRLSNDSGSQMTTHTSLNGTSTSGISNPVMQSNNYHDYDGEYSIVQPSKARSSAGEIEVDKAVLVDRICRLQKAHAKKNEKLEFLEEHNRSLLDDIKKKNKVIQFYVLREEAGTLISSRFDKNKAEMSKKGGIMASIYSSRVSDKDMTLDLSLEINRKLQAVVEDTLLKNITLKESLNTLGTEIAQLQEDLKRARK